MRDLTMLAKPLIPLDAALLHACQNTIVITASERVRAALVHAYDAFHVDGGTRTWRSARILTLGAYVKQRYDELLCGTDTNYVLLGAHAQRLAWLDHAPEGIEVDFDAIYDDVAAAWRIVHDWDLQNRLHQFADNDNHRLLRDWANRYRRTAQRRRWLTEAELPGVIAEALRLRQLPAEPTTFVGFDVITPSVSQLVAALRGAGGAVTIHENEAARASRSSSVTYENVEQELDAAVRWAHDVLLSTGEPLAIGIAIPDVVTDYDRIVRHLESGLRPMNRDPDPASCPYNLSGGIPLVTVPVVAIALQLLHWLVQPLHHADVESLVRSPFLSLDAFAVQSQRGEMPESYDAGELARRLVAPPLRAIVGRAQTRTTASLADTIMRMKGTLEAAGWPNAASLTSESYQAYRSFLELLDELSAASSVVRADTFNATLANVRSAARRCLFAPKRPNAPVQVLGYLETANLRFTHLWIAGMSDLTWPGSARPNVYIPLRVLRDAGVPRVDAESELAFARRLTRHWRSAGQQVVFSSPRVEDESPCRVSRLVEETSAYGAAPPYPYSHPFLIRRTNVALEFRDDDRGQPLTVAALRHRGSQILRDQSACPFRAFARHRLHASERPLPHSFFDAADRGTATHVALRETYERIQQRDDNAIDDPQLEELVISAVVAALSTYARFPTAFLANERKRLTELVLEWLRFEKTRLPTRPTAFERATTLTLGPLTFQLQIDRIDRLDDDGVMVIDYKTGASDAYAVFGERPEEPQLAMYALAVADVQAIAFARVKHDECRLAGWSNPSQATHEAIARHLRAPPPEPTWEALLDSWRSRLTRLASEFMDGVADVSPRNAAACRQCNLHGLCRIRETHQPGTDEFNS